MDKPNNILTTNKLCIGYNQGKQQDILFADLNLSAQKAQLICLLGANGIGKSSLLRTLAKLQPALSGSIFLKGQDIHQLNEKYLAKEMALVLSQSPQGVNFSIQELVALGRFPYTSWSGKLMKVDLEKVDEAMGLAEVTSFRHKNIYQVSDGQFQKALIARALAQDCPLMILDEPTVHLDANNRYMVMKLLQKITQETGKTIIMSTHQISMAADLADVIWLAKAPKELLVDSPKNLLTNNELQNLFPYEKFG